MTNFNNPQGSSDEDNVPLTPNEKSYREGYVRGRVGNEETQFERERAAENGGTANGLVIGGILTALLGLGAAAVYYWSKPADTVPTTIINNPPTPAASVAPKPEKETKIIDRTIEKTAPPQVKVVEVEKQVPGPTKVIQVPKPVLVPGATKVIEVPKPAVAPASPSPTASQSPVTVSPSPAPAAAPTPTPSQSPESSSSPSPSADPGNN